MNTMEEKTRIPSDAPAEQHKEKFKSKVTVFDVINYFDAVRADLYFSRGIRSVVVLRIQSGLSQRQSHGDPVGFQRRSV